MANKPQEPKGKMKKHKSPCVLATPFRGNHMRPCTCKKRKKDAE